MNENEAARIAAAVNQLRPDWPAKSLLTLIEKHLMARPRRDVAVALAWVACESATTTPARVLEQTGPWWKAVNAEHPELAMRRPPKPHEECGAHPGEYRLGCRLHAADRKARHDEATAASRLSLEQQRREAREQIRANAAAAQARLNAELHPKETP